MVRRRARGGGRKPKGEFPGKSAVFSTRITPILREALDKEAEQNGRSLSQEVELRLRDSIDMPTKLLKDWGAPPHIGLARAVSMLSQRVESITGAKWQQDAFAFETLRKAIDIFLVHFAPTTWTEGGPFDVPAMVEKTAANIARYFPEQADFSRRPEGVGSSIALGLIESLKVMETPPLTHPRNVHFADEYYSVPRLRDELGINQKLEAKR